MKWDIEPRSSAVSRTSFNIPTSALGACAVVAQLSFGCSLLIEVQDDQCATDADCAAVGLPGRCVDRVCSTQEPVPCVGEACGFPVPVVCNGVPCDFHADPVCFNAQCASEALVRPFLCETPLPTTDDFILFEVKVAEYTTPNAALAGLVVTACLPMDVGCANPVTQARDDAMTGIMQLYLPRGFNGYLEFKSDTTMPLLWHFVRPLNAPVGPQLRNVASYTTIGLLAELSGADVDLNKGIVIMEAHDCSGLPQGGIHFVEGTGTALPFYLVDLLPNLKAQVSVYDELNGFAIGGFFNVTPAFTLLSARIGVDGPELFAYNTFIRGGAMSFLSVAH